MAKGKLDLMALIAKKPAGLSSGSSGDEEDEEDEEDVESEDGSEDGPTLMEQMHKAMKAGDYVGAFGALEQAVMLCGHEEE